MLQCDRQPLTERQTLVITCDYTNFATHTINIGNVLNELSISVAVDLKVCKTQEDERILFLVRHLKGLPLQKMTQRQTCR